LSFALPARLDIARPSNGRQAACTARHVFRVSLLCSCALCKLHANADTVIAGR
jgi:hypothetical protein